MAASDRTWINGALGHWRTSERTLLKLDQQPLPTIYAIDARCTYRRHAGTGAWRGDPHGGSIRLPGAPPPKVGPIAFASARGATRYFAIGLPSVWRAAGVTSTIGLERLMDGVMLHELVHTRQFHFANPTLKAISARYGLGDDIDDDSLQARFGKDPAYRAAYFNERDMLFAAAAASSDAEARRLAGEALKMMRARHQRWFVGGDARWAALDDIFLTMEGAGQWLAYAWLTSPAGEKLPRATALRGVRRDGKQWSQDQGLALFLTIDRLVPGWQRLAFAKQPHLATALLERAARG